MTSTARVHVLAAMVVATIIVVGRAEADMYPVGVRSDHWRQAAGTRQDLWILRNLRPTDQDDRVLLGQLTAMTPTQYRDYTGEVDLYAKRPFPLLGPDLPYDGRNGLPVRMSAADWYRRPRPGRATTAESATLGAATPVAIGLGVVALVVLGWWLRRYA